ncbi:60S Ribosomal Protein L7 [Manis pentadactyla]|nr:60S Ribosomal Protein L7 [Manis pentadactyla]
MQFIVMLEPYLWYSIPTLQTLHEWEYQSGYGVHQAASLTPGEPGGHYHMTKALPQFIFLPVHFPFAFLESCCITEAGNTDVLLKSQWKVLT